MQWYRSGDEPLYIMNTQSLVKDKDFDLANNCDASYLNIYTDHLGLTNDFSDERNLLFYAKVFFHSGTFSKVNGQWKLYSAGGIGLPLLLAPGYLIAGKAGMVAVVSLLAILTLLMVYGLLVERGTNHAQAFALTTGVGLLSPFVFYASHFYPEIPAAFILVLMVKFRQPVPWFGEILLGAAAGYLAWLSTRMLPLLLGCAVIRIWVNRTELRTLLLFITFTVIVTAGSIAYNLHIHGSFVNNGMGIVGAEAALYNFYPAEAPTTKIGLLATFIAHFLDSDFGLIPFYPFLTLYLVVLIANWRSGQIQTWLFFLFFGYTTIISFVPWFGTYCFPARYLTPLMPLFALSKPRFGKAARWLAVIGALWVIIGNVYPSLIFQPTFYTKFGLPFPRLSNTNLTGTDIGLTIFWMAILIFSILKTFKICRTRNNDL